MLNNVHDDITISGEPVHYVTSYLYLGVDIDKYLTFKPYYANMYKKITYKLSLLCRIRHMITTKAALDITKTMFCSIIDREKSELSIDISFMNIPPLSPEISPS